MRTKPEDMSKKTSDHILSQQRAWAKQADIKTDQDGYTLSLDDNLFIPLSSNTVEEFGSGKGDEFGTDSRRGKMRALHSSSALVCNFFEYWRGHNSLDTIAQACGVPAGMSKMHFESPHPTTLRGTPPHLDLEFLGENLKPLAIESKFAEPYHHTPATTFTRSYLTTLGLWDSLPRCGRLVRDIQDKKVSFFRLDVPQLLKHALGLTASYGPSGFQLLYLWYEVPSPETAEHRKDIEAFTESIEADFVFRSMTYQELFNIVRKLPEAESPYIEYLGARYFS